MKDFSDTIIEIKKIDNHNVNSVYSVANSLWHCYLNVDINANLLEALNLVLYCVEEPIIFDGSSLVRKTDISLARLPVHLASAVKNINGDRFQDVIEYVKACKDDIQNQYMVDIIKKLFLLLIFQILHNIPGSDIYSLINKCIVLDHLGDDVTRGSKIDITLKKLNEKTTLLLKQGEQISAILLLVGRLNYRLNNYTEAIRFLSIYAEQLEKQNEKKTVDNFANKLAEIYIFIGYCYEKKITKDQSQSLQSLNTAIEIFNDIQNSCKCFQFNDCEIKIKTEIFHGLAHFYNERAVFHASSRTTKQQYDDIMCAQKYISIAKEMDDRNAFHSCHGLICYENSDYERAATIYEGAKNLKHIIDDKELRSEIEFYQAQTMSALGDNLTANELLNNIESYFESIHNDDAIVHVRILRTKSQLAELGLFETSPKDSNFFHDLLNSLLERGLSMYAPISIEIEWRKIVFALNIFYYICKIREYSISFETGIEEIVYNLRKYYSTNTSLEERQRIRVSKRSFDSESKKEVTLSYVEDFRGKQCEEDVIFLLNVNNVQLICFGKDFSEKVYGDKSNFGIGYKKKIKAEYESNVVGQIRNNQRSDIILVNPSAKLATSNNRKQILRDIIATGVCVIALGEEGEQIARSCATRLAINRIYRANSERELIQMSYLFRVYEMLRCDLTTPTPLLGLAPLSDSKSYSFQTCQKIEDLFIPNPDISDVDISPFAQIITALESIQIEHFNRARKLKEYNDKFNQIISCVVSDIAFLAFFPIPQDENDLNFRVPYAIFDNDFFKSYKYVLQTIELKKIVSHKPFAPYYTDYMTLDGEIRKKASTFCKRRNCNKTNCHGSIILFSDNDTIKNTIHNLMNKIFPITDQFFGYYCFCCTFNETDMSGICIVMIKNNQKDIEQKAKLICEKIHNVSVAQKIQEPSKINTRKQEPHKDTIIPFAKENIVWVTLSDLKNKLEKAKDSAIRASIASGTREETQQRAVEISESIQKFIETVNEVISKKASKVPGINYGFFKSIKKIIEEKTWEDYLNNDISDNFKKIIEFSEQKGMLI
jgi:hypothetical protein